MKFTKEEIYGVAGSTVFCFIILLILLFTVLKTVISTDEEGILVNFGTLDEGTGLFEPANTGSSNQTSVDAYIPPQPSVASEQVAISQNVEETVSIPDTKKADEDKKKQEELRRAEDERRRVETAERQRRAEEERRQQAISNQVAGAFGIGNSNSTSQGSGGGTGNEGSPQGNSDHGANTGVGGHGEFSLSGRSVGRGGLPKPAYSIQEEGRIVVDITVNPKGQVIHYAIGKGTNIDNASMRKSALEAASKATFNEISGNTNQSGTITYRYNLR